jgi:DNA-binding transcriptional ArsR family regulator
VSAALALLDTPERVASALPGLRRRLLDRLREPASAAELAREFGIPRQKLNYHLRVLEGQHLLELVEVRPRRGFTERVLRTVAGALVVDPGVLGATAPGDGDRHAADHLVRTAGAMVRDVGRMAVRADAGGKRLLTFTLETEVRFAAPGDVHDFTDALAQAVATVVARFDTPGGRPYRLLAAGHPAAQSNEEESDAPTAR